MICQILNPADFFLWRCKKTCFFKLHRQEHRSSSMVLESVVVNAAPRADNSKMEKSNSSGNNNNDIHRPTEAQLRWAQFHHKARARETKEQMERLWHTPLAMKDVDGVLSDDGASTCSDSSADSRKSTSVKRSGRPKVSRGRRALLKVSQRGYDKRRAFIQEQGGFQCSADKENDENEDENDVFEGNRRSKSGGHGRCLPNDDEDRKNRFEAAYTMMKNLKPSQKPLIVRTTKRWTRPKNVQDADESAGTNFQDWKWGLARRKRTADSRRMSRMANMPFDRRATWLVHLPARESSVKSRRYMYNQPMSSDGEFLQPVCLYEGTDLLSPGQLKFDEMVSRLQDCDNAPIPEQDILNVSARYLDSLPTSEPIESPRVVRRPRKTMDSSFEEPSEEYPIQVIRRPRDSIGERYEEFMQYGGEQEEEESHRIVRRPRSGISDQYEENLMQQHQRGRVSEAHSMGTIGSVESDFYEKARHMHDTTPLEHGDISRRFSKHASGLGAIPESSDKPHASTGERERPVGRGRENVPSDASDEDDFDPNDPRTTEYEGRPMAATPRKSNSDPSRSGTRFSIDSHATSTASTDIQTPRSQIRESGALLDGATPISDYGDTGRTEATERSSAPSAASSFRFGAAKLAGGFFQMLTGKNAPSSDDGSELRAVAAFRETQKGRQENQEGSTSTASFRLLPEGIRRIVLGGASSSQRETKQHQAEDSGERFYPDQEQPPGLDHFNPSSHSSDQLSPVRSFSSRSQTNSLSPEHGRLVHQKIMEDSALFGDTSLEQTIIDTDDTTSDASGSVMDAETAANLMMSPTILTKRHQQAIKAIERRNWEQITYLLSANPWLAEMMEVTTQQYLLHKVALYGASKFLWSDENDAVDVIQAAPQELNQDMIRMFPSSVHKFDQDGNLPLHMAAASGNIEMAIFLGERFPSGASVRNNDGMLPLHLAVQACATPLANACGEMVYGADFVAMILQLFPGAVAVADSEGDLPLHIAAAALEGEVGVDIIYLLLDEADRQATSDSGLRFTEKVRSKTDDDSIDDDTIATEGPNDSSNMDDDDIHCSMVRNEMGRNALTKAVEAGSGWQVIEAIARGPGGVRAALMQDAKRCNALHLLLSEEFGDPQAALSILKLAPATATARNADRMLPVEIACRHEMPDEVILAMVLVDSPVDLSSKDSVRVKEGFGGSWWFLTCESDDQFVDLVEEVISICSYEHLREMCYMKGGHDGSGAPVLARATPMCRDVLHEALRI